MPGEASTILVVDDEAPVRKMVQAMLTCAGYQVLEACCGSEALEVSDQHPDIDLVITDINMPGMDGWELASRLHTLRPRMKILAMSGKEPNKQEATGTALPFLEKPFTHSIFLGKVHEVLSEKK